MKLKRLLESITELTDADQKLQVEKYRQLKNTLKQLKKKCRELEKKVDNERDESRVKELNEKLLIISTQRQKGLLLLKQLNEREKQR